MQGGNLAIVNSRQPGSRRSCHSLGIGSILMFGSSGRTCQSLALMEGLMINFVRVCAGLLLTCGVASSASAQTKWDMPTPYPDGNFHTRNVAPVCRRCRQGDQWFAQDRGSLGRFADKHPEIKRRVRQGTAPIGEMLESLSSNEAAGLWMDSVPFLATGYDASQQTLRRAEALSRKAARLRGIDSAVSLFRGRRRGSTPSARSSRSTSSRVSNSAPTTP